jgi:hemerythrin superfamily protein
LHSSDGMSANNELFRVLVEQHREVDELLEQLANTDESETDERARLFETMKAKLLSHAKAEEKTFYVALQRAGEKGDAKHAKREHREIEAALKAVDECDYDDEQFLEKVEELADCVTHHVEEEEGEIFDSAAEAISVEHLDRIAEEFLAQQKEELAALGLDDGFDELTKQELLEKARDLDLEGRSSMTKEELISHLRQGG